MEIIAEMVAFPSNAHTTPGFLARPADLQQHPGVVVIQEYWGLVPHIEEVARRFAHAGFVALAPDLYHGQKATEPDEARKLAMELDRDRAVLEIQAAARYLQTLAAVEPKKIGVVGWCMGGGLSLATAASSPEVGAAVAFYGMPRDAGILAQIHVPTLGLYAEHDHSITPEMVQRLDQTLEQSGTPHEVRLYPGTEHAFFNDTRPHIYNREAAEDAWQRTLAWLRQHLV